eukprot:502905-Pelagomonas_calceolata.AAC.6
MLPWTRMLHGHWLALKLEQPEAAPEVMSKRLYELCVDECSDLEAKNGAQLLLSHCLQVRSQDPEHRSAAFVR